MKLDTSTLMMIFFVLFFVISMYKIYAFLPNKQLADDDTTKESQKELTKLMLHVIKSNNKNLSVKELFLKIKSDDSFNKEHYWRFNQNRLNQLLNHYYLQNPHVKNIADIYKDLK